jgi:hypothetical protein
MFFSQLYQLTALNRAQQTQIALKLLNMSYLIAQTEFLLVYQEFCLLNVIRLKEQPGIATFEKI